MRRAWLWIPLALGCIACAEESTPRPAAQQAFDTLPGDHRLSLEHGGLTRTCLLHIPPGYDAGRLLPLVLFFHGGMGSSRQAAESYGWSELADRAGFLVAYPDGTGRVQTWNAVHGCGSARRDGVDDVSFVKALLASLAKDLAIDPRRVYATGFSNGAFLTYRLASEIPELLAAAAPVAGAIGGRPDPGAPEARIRPPARPIPLIVFHGKRDLNVLYEGGRTRKGFEPDRVDLSVDDAVAFWTKANRCREGPAREASGSGNVIRQAWTSGEGGADLVVYTLLDQGHAWPGGKPPKARIMDAPSTEVSATELIWAFFATHPRRDGAP